MYVRSNTVKVVSGKISIYTYKIFIS